MMAKTIKTPLGNAPAVPVLLILIGAYFAWYGVHYFKSDSKWPTDPIKSVLQGNGTPATAYTQEQQRQASVTAYVQQAVSAAGSGGSPGASLGGAVGGNTLGGAVGGNTLGGTVGGRGAIAADAMRYVGSGYRWGGPADQPGNWDCSSFVSYVLGHDLGLPLPGGHWGDPGFPPHTHGPTTGSYALFGTQINESDVQAGDLVVWSTHVGIATSPIEIVSAEDTQLGTGTSTIAGTTRSLGESPRFRRVPLS